MDYIIYYLLSAAAVLLVLSIHEVSHGFVANRLGDPTARLVGRLSLNPIRHIDPIGAVCMVLFHFGWAKPVPINTRFFKNPKRDMAFTALAGPLSNFLISFLVIPLYLLLELLASSLGIMGVPLYLLSIPYTFLLLVHQISLGLGLFNLIPIPPLDGSRVLFAFLPDRYYYKIMLYERQIALGLTIALLLGARFGFLTTLSNFLSGSMESVWRLIPAFR